MASGALYPLIYLIFQSVVNSFVAMGRNQTNFVSANNSMLGW